MKTPKIFTSFLRRFYLLGTGVFLLCLISNSLAAQPGEISPSELKQLLDNNPDVQLVDVREKWEVKKATIPNGKHMPLKEVVYSTDQLDINKPVVTYCHFGNRSRVAAEILINAGFKDVKVLKGGIDAYSIQVDPSIPRY